VYLKGEYSRTCCPEYLKPENFERLKSGLVERVSSHTNSVQGFLDKHNGDVSKYVLLDHMDWLSDKFFPLLELEWEAIIRRAAPKTRIIWRSGGLRTDFLERVNITHAGKIRQLPELLTFQTDVAAKLHPQDRVHTYGSFYIADLAT
jgi:S-adenosylmethionine-diacylglycerol 3-amino-3-carboxypropyl transferase